MTTLADRILRLLAERGESQTALAKFVGCRPASVNDWISGKTQTIKGVNLLRAAEFFGVNPLWLASGRGKPEAGSEDGRLIREIRAREIPPHIEQSIISLLETCPAKAAEESSDDQLKNKIIDAAKRGGADAETVATFLEFFNSGYSARAKDHDAPIKSKMDTRRRKSQR